MRILRIVAAAVLTLAPLAAVAEDGFRPRVIVSWESRDTRGTTTSRLRQEIDLFLTRELTDSMTLRLNLGANYYDLATDRPGFETPSTRALELRPSGMFSVHVGPVVSDTEVRLRRSRFDTAGLRTSRNDEQGRSSLSWAPSRFVPGGTFTASRGRIGDGESGVRIVNDSLDGEVSWSIGGLTAIAGQALRVDRDTRSGYERSLNDSRAAVSFADSWFRGKLAVTAGVNGTISNVDDRAAAGVRIPTYVQPARAYWGVDDTPLDSSDRPLSPYPTLIDGRSGVSTGIDLGPQGASFQAIAFDVGRVSPVDQVQIVVLDERLEPVTQPAGIDFDVYVSTDGVRWTPHTAGLTSGFDAVRSRYEVSFEQTDVRWIKVVTFGTAAQTVLVTEALLLYHTESSRPDNDSQFRMLASNATVVLTPLRGVTVGYTGAGYQSTQRSGASLEGDVRDFVHQLSARWDPGPRLGYELRWEMQDSSTERFSQDARALIGSVRFTPRPQLSTLLTCESRNQMLDRVAIDSRNCSTQVSARIYRGLDVVGGGSMREQVLESGGTLTTRSFHAGSNARLTPSLRLTLSATVNRSTLDGWDGPLAPPSSDDRATADVDWTRGHALGLGGTFGWARGTNASGIVQRYRIRWSPFGDGSISLMTSYTRDIDPYTDGRSERLMVSPRWQINPRTALNLLYSSVRTSGENPLQSESLLASLIYGR